MAGGRIHTKMLKGKVHTTRRKERPRIRWLVDVLADLVKMRVRGYREQNGRQKRTEV